MTDPSPTSLAIFKAVRASLRLASSSSELLTIAQLLALKGDLRETLAIISGQIRTEESGTFAKNVVKCLETHSCFTDDHKVIIDLSDWESTSDEEEEDGIEDASGADGKCPILPNLVAAHSRGSQVMGAEMRLLVCWFSKCVGTGTDHSPISPNTRPLSDKPTRDGRITGVLVHRRPRYGRRDLHRHVSSRLSL